MSAIILTMALLYLAPRIALADALPAIDFARDVRPILSNHCFQCHGPDENARKAELRLDTPEGAYRDLGGRQAVNPRDATSSALLARVTSADPDERMPPPDSGKVLTDVQISTLRAWIASGGKYEQHWSFRRVATPPIPSVANACDPLDAFILQKLREARLAPSAQADRHTLLRRVWLDLLGLPPAPEDIDSFLADVSPDAYERLVDRVLASPGFGERWGRHWLDQARYADTNGYTNDTERSIWPYRDWVIQAVNADQPFDQFTIEQLAGDLLPSPTQDQWVATGFHRNSLVNEEGGTDDEQFRNESVVDRVNTTGAVWLGLTVGCAQCHSHKYDPLTQREYYQLFAFFNNTEDVNTVAPTTLVASVEERKRLHEFDQAMAVASNALAEFDKKRDSRRPPAVQDDGKPIPWKIVEATSVTSAGGATFDKLADGSFVAGGANADSDHYTVSFRATTPRIAAVRLETLTHPSLPKGGPGRAANGNFVLNHIAMTVNDAEAKWIHASADHSQKNYDVRYAIDGDPASGWAIKVEGGNLNVDRTATFVAAPVDAGDGAVVTIKLIFAGKPPRYNIGRFRLSVTDAPHSKFDLPDPDRAPLAAALKTASDAKANYAKSIPTTMVMRERKEPRPTHVLIRGDFLRKGDLVSPDTPAFLPAMPAAGSPRARLDLARWLVSPDNPLTPRVTVNRIWMRLFGQGLVETENDFGYQGTAPTHPDLLDWLASAFIDGGWSVKRAIRAIVTSAAYRRTSTYRPDIDAADPLNKLLARQNRVRVDAEIVRDLALASSGLLVDTLGGPSVYPPQPDGVYAFTQRAATWPTSKGADRYRRGMYTFFMRSAPNPMLTTFDAPAFNTTCTRRVRSNTPLQSLTMANDEAMIEAARALAQRLVDAASHDHDRIERAYRFCFSRPPRSAELDRLMAFASEQRRDLADRPNDAKAMSAATQMDVSDCVELATWTMVARVLLNTDEFITRE